MTPRKDTRFAETDLYPNDTDPAVATAIARASEPRARTGDESMHIFWRVFGGAIVSICALVAITLYNNLQSGLSELRGEITKLNEARADHVRKDEFNNRISTNYERLSSLQGQAAGQATAVAAVKADLDGLKEKLATAVAEMKLTREESLRLRADVDRNQIADGERKAHRDEQYKIIEKSLKDLQAALQDCQLKLARLEGQTQAPPVKKEPTKAKD